MMYCSKSKELVSGVDRRLRFIQCFLGVILLVQPVQALVDPVQYSVSFRDADQHAIEIEASIPTSGKSEIELFLPVWTPGSYLVREYARHIESIVATDSQSAESRPIVKQDKNTWVVPCRGSDQLKIRYRVYCREMSVRTNWVDREFAFLTGAATFITRSDYLEHPHHVRLEPLPHWPEIATSLKPLNANQKWTRSAVSYHELVDSPILIGKMDIQSFLAGSSTHHLATLGGEPAWNHPQMVKDVERIVLEEQAFWGSIPYQDYWFLNIVSEMGGGLEHDDSCVLMTTRFAPRKRESYLNWLALVSHEFFHTWNVRRLRPAALKQYDYRAEQYFPELWIAEGVTSYYDDLLVAKAGLCSSEEYLTSISKNIQSVQSAEGRLVQSLADSSWDTWIKFYRPDENSNNSRVNYYTKGALVAMLLDVEIQQSTDGRSSLRDVMIQLWKSHEKSGYTLDDFYRVSSGTCNKDLQSWFETHISQATDLDFQPLLHWYGLRFKAKKENTKNPLLPPPPSTKNGSESTSESTNGDNSKSKSSVDKTGQTNSPIGQAAYLGAETTNVEGRMVVKRVARGSAASQGGLNAEDEIIALDGLRVGMEPLADRLEHYRAGDEMRMTVARRGRLMELSLKLGAKPTQNWELEIDPEASELQKSRYANWLRTHVP